MPFVNKIKFSKNNRIIVWYFCSIIHIQVHGDLKAAYEMYSERKTNYNVIDLILNILVSLSYT